MKLAGCVIKNKEGRVLLMHRNTPTRTQWEIPGGKVDPGEEPLQTAIRELKEELDVAVLIIRKIGVKMFEQDGSEHEYHWFEAKITDGEPRLVESHMYDELKHFSIEEMHKIKEFLSANTRNLVHAVQKQEITL